MAETLYRNPAAKDYDRSRSNDKVRPLYGGTQSAASDAPYPHNVEAEQAVLGALLVDRDAIVKIAPLVKPDDFFIEKHAWIYETVHELYDKREPDDFVLVMEELRRRDRLEAIGGPSYLTQLITKTPTAVHAEYYAKIILRYAVMRRLIHAGVEITRLGYDDRLNTEEALDQAQQLIVEVAADGIKKDAVRVSAILEEYFDRLAFLQEHKGQLVGVPTGFADLDKLTGGLQKSDLIIMAGRPGTGKTSLALGIAYNLAYKAKRAVAIFSLEMSRDQLVQRMLAMETGVDSQRLRTGYINDEEWDRISRAFGKLAEAPIFIDDSGGMTLGELRTKARRLHAEHNIELLIVDYLQLLTTGAKSDNRVQEVSEISRSMKLMARELNIPVIACAQLSRAVESRTDHIPKLSDLRESGSIEQDADIVAFIYRDEMYNPETEKKNVAEIHIAKHRNGPVDVVPLYFHPKTTKFANMEVYRPDQ